MSQGCKQEEVGVRGLRPGRGGGAEAAVELGCVALGAGAREGTMASAEQCHACTTFQGWWLSQGISTFL